MTPFILPIYFYQSIDYVQNLLCATCFRNRYVLANKTIITIVKTLHQITSLMFYELSIKMESVWESLNISLPRSGDIIAFWQTTLWQLFPAIFMCKVNGMVLYVSEKYILKQAVGRRFDP